MANAWALIFKRKTPNAGFFYFTTLPIELRAYFYQNKTMEQSLRLTASTAATLVTLEEVKLMAKVDIAADNSIFTQQVSAAVKWCENYINQSINTNTYQLTVYDLDIDRDLENTGALMLALPMLPVSDVSSVKSFNTKGEETTLTLGDEYYLIPNVKDVLIASPVDFGYIVNYTAGMSTVETAGPIKEVVLKLVVELYSNRSLSVTGTITTEMIMGLRELLDTYKVKLWL